MMRIITLLILIVSKVLLFLFLCFCVSRVFKHFFLIFCVTIVPFHLIVESFCMDEVFKKEKNHFQIFLYLKELNSSDIIYCSNVCDFVFQEMLTM